MVVVWLLHLRFGGVMVVGVSVSLQNMSDVKTDGNSDGSCMVLCPPIVSHFIIGFLWALCLLSTSKCMI